MRIVSFLFSLLITCSATAQLTLKACLENGWANRASLRTAKSEELIAGLKTLDDKSKFRPQIDLAYEYRYNPIIVSQIVPVGQFSPTPTSETRAIQFGTPWQQTAGLTAYQPLLDLALKSRIRESQLNETLSRIDTRKAELELGYEIARSYSRILSLGYQVTQAEADTLRTYRSYTLLENRFKEGKVLRTEVNTALVNHYTNLNNFQKAVASLLTEKIFLHYLTAIPLERVLNETFGEIPASLFTPQNNPLTVNTDSLPEYQQLEAQSLLLQQQLRTEKSKNIPQIGLQGFLGANQFSQNFNPFLANSWFGNSYIALSVKLPLLSPNKSTTAGRQIQAQLNDLQNKKAELTSEKNRDLLQQNIELQQINSELALVRSSLALLNDNIRIYQERLQAGQLAQGDLNVQETEIQKLAARLKELNEQQQKVQIDRLYSSGGLMEKIKKM